MARALPLSTRRNLEAIEPTHKDWRRNFEELRELADGVYVKIQIGIGRSKGELSKNPITAMVNWLLDQRSKKKGKVQTLSVEGVSPHGEEVDINFLKARIEENIELSYHGNNVAKNYKARHSALESAMNKHKEALKAFVKS